MNNQLRLVEPPNPAMTQEQFDFDMATTVADSILQNPSILAFMVRNLGERLTLVEGRTTWLMKIFRKRYKLKSVDE